MSLRSIAPALVVAALVAAGCTSAESSASPGEEPLPTIGLGSDLDFGSFIDRDDQAVGAAQIDTIVMIGDSITDGSTPALETAFAELGFGEPVIVSAPGKRMVEGVGSNIGGADVAEVLTSVDEGPGDDLANELWIVALGTNDIGQYSPDETAAAVNEVLANVPGDAPVVWVDTYFRDEQDTAALVNEIIADRVGRRGNAVVAPWSFFAPGDGVLRSDGVHPSSSGTEMFAAVVAETVSRFLGR